MKKTPILTLAIGLFTLTLAFATFQGLHLFQENIAASGSAQFLSVSGILPSGFNLFNDFFNALVGLLGQNLFLSMIVLALIVELVLLYPSAAIQLKQKKIHLFHKKLVDRFQSGQLTLSKSKQELGVMYAVNEKLHRRGALLFMIQLAVFSWVLLSLLRLLTQRPESWSALSQFNLILLDSPTHFLLPSCLALAYFLHSLIKIQFKQKEDYINPWQSRLSLFIALMVAISVFTFSTMMPVLLSVYMIHLITFSTLRYSLVEWRAKAWGKTAHRQLVALLIHTSIHKSRFQKWRMKLNHSAFARHFNLHMLEEAASMSLMIGLIVTQF